MVNSYNRQISFILLHTIFVSSCTHCYAVFLNSVHYLISGNIGWELILAYCRWNILLWALLLSAPLIIAQKWDTNFFHISFFCKMAKFYILQTNFREYTGIVLSVQLSVLLSIQLSVQLFPSIYLVRSSLTSLWIFIKFKWKCEWCKIIARRFRSR